MMDTQCKNSRKSALALEVSAKNGLKSYWRLTVKRFVLLVLFVALVLFASTSEAAGRRRVAGCVGGNCGVVQAPTTIRLQAQAPVVPQVPTLDTLAPPVSTPAYSACDSCGCAGRQPVRGFFRRVFGRR